MMAMPQKTISKHNSSPAARSVAEASVSSSSSDELFSDVSCCVFPSARQRVVVELGELASCWMLESQVLRGTLEVFLVISGGILSASFGRVPFPGPGIKWRGSLAPGGPRRYHLWQFWRSLEPAPVSAPRKKSAPLIFFSCLFRPHRARTGHREERREKMGYNFVKADTRRG